MTVDNVFALLSGPLVDREWSYVALSRHRKQLRVFVMEDQLEQVPENIFRSRQKDVSVDYLAMEHREFQESQAALELD